MVPEGVDGAFDRSYSVLSCNGIAITDYSYLFELLVHFQFFTIINSIAVNISALNFWL